MSTQSPGPNGVNGPSTPFSIAALDPSIPADEKGMILALIALGGVATYAALHSALGLHGSAFQRHVRDLEARCLVVRERQGSRTWVVRLVEPPACPVAADQSRKVVPKREQNLLPPNTPRPGDSLVRALIANGVWRSVALRLAKEHDEKLVFAWIEQAQCWGDDLRNRGGWIRYALDGHWRIPSKVHTFSPEEQSERVAQAVWAAMCQEDKKALLHKAKAENSVWCRTAREIAGWCPSLRDGMNAAIGFDYTRRRLETEGLP